MPTTDLQTKIVALFAPVIEAMGYELWGIVLLGEGRNSLLRVYIDKEEGVTVDGCERVSKQISAILEAEDLMQGRYSLEVSSPGLDRPLFNKAQYERYVGEKVRVKLRAAQNGVRNYMGEISKVTADDIILIVDSANILIPIINIDRAKLIPEF